MNSIGRLLVWLLPLCNVLGGSPGYFGADEPTLTLPDLKVSTQVPLEKVADFKMKEKRFAPAAVTDGRYIYIIGGLDDSGALLDTVERFDPASGSSEEFARLHTGRLWHQAVFRQGKIYVLGGSSQAAGADSLSYFDDLRGLPEARANARINDYNSQPTGMRLMLEDSVEIIDLATRQVSAGVRMPQGKNNFGCVVLENELYILGGKSVYASRLALTNMVQIFSFTTGNWRDGLNMPTPRETPATLVDGPFIVVPGGYNGLRALDVVEAFDPRTGAWITLPKLCRPVSAHSLVFMGHHLFIFGNYEAPQELIAYDLVTKTSETFTLRYAAARHTAALVLNGKIYVIGGKVYKDSAALDYIQVFAPPQKAAPAK